MRGVANPWKELLLRAGRGDGDVAQNRECIDDIDDEVKV